MVVLNARAVVDASEVFDEDVQGAVEGDVHEDAVLVHHTVEFAHLLAVHIDGGIVGNARHVHHTLDGLVEMAAVEHVAEALSQIFKVHRLVGLHGLLRFQHREHVGRLVEIYIGNRDDGNALGDVGNGVGHVLLHQFAHAQEFLRGPSCFADRRVVVVGGEVGLNIRVVVVVGARPETKVRATVHHIEVEIDPVVEVLLRLVHNALGRNAHEGFVPVVQPSGIELCHHIGALAVVVLVDYVFEVLHIVFAVGRGQCALDGTTFKEPRTIARKHRNVEASVQQCLSDGRTVPFVLGKGDVGTLRHVRAKLILGLHHNDGAAVGDLQVLHLCCQLVDIYAAGIQKRLVVGTNHEVLFLLQPPGITAVFPFGAAIGSRA